MLNTPTKLIFFFICWSVPMSPGRLFHFSPIDWKEPLSKKFAVYQLISVRQLPQTWGCIQSTTIHWILIGNLIQLALEEKPSIVDKNTVCFLWTYFLQQNKVSKVHHTISIWCLAIISEHKDIFDDCVENNFRQTNQASGVKIFPLCWTFFVRSFVSYFLFVIHLFL